MLAKDSLDYEGLDELVAAERNLRRYLRRKFNLVLSLLEGREIFEAGCGIGTFTRVLSGKGYRISACDTSAKCLKICGQRRIRATFFQSDICDINGFIGLRGRFDSVIMLTMLEHAKADDRALLNARLLLRSGGVLVVIVPAFKFLFSNLDRKIGHYRRYSKPELLKKIKMAGFQIEYLRFWDLLGFVGWLVKCKLMKSTRVSQDLAKPLFDKIYDRWLSIEDCLVVPIGVDLILKARKV